MKKIALRLTAVSMLLAGLAGCGDMDNAGMDDTQTGYNLGRGGNNQTTGHGLNQRTGYTTDQGTRDGRGIGQGHGFGGNTRDGAGQGHGMGGAFETNRDDGAGLTGRNRGFGTNNRGTTRQNTRGNDGGFARGITGDDRPGMVDEDGILNGRVDRNITRGLTGGQHRGLMDRASYQGRNATQERGGKNRMQGYGGENPMQGRGGQTTQDQGRNGTHHANRGDAGTYANGEDGRLSRKIDNRVSRMNNVRDCDVVVNGDNVIVGVEADGNERGIEDQVRSELSNLSDDYDIYVVTDDDQVNNVRGMGDRLRAGEPFEEIGETFNDMVQDLGRAIQRPFERSR